MTGPTHKTRAMAAAKRHNLRKMVDRQAATLLGYWNEREGLFARVRRWRIAALVLGAAAAAEAVALLARFA